MLRRFALLIISIVASYATVVAQNSTAMAIPEGCSQFLVVSNYGKGATKHSCLVELMSVDDNKTTTVATIKGVVGYGGVTTADLKCEGDGKTPIGVYALKRGLCYAKDFESAFPMVVYDEDDMWSEDVNSADYNTFVENPDPERKGDRLWQRHDTLFRYIVVVEYNTDPIVAGAGSAIFMHAWRAEGKPTAGCVAMAESDIKRIVEWLDPELRPHIMIMPN